MICKKIFQKLTETTHAMDGKLMLKNLNKQDNGEYECMLPNGESELVKLTIFGKENDLNLLDILDPKTNSTSNGTQVGLKRLYSQSCKLKIYFIRHRI